MAVPLGTFPVPRREFLWAGAEVGRRDRRSRLGQLEAIQEARGCTPC